jgi:hypothetical protein
MATKYGRLTIVRDVGDGKAEVRCDCGNEKIVRIRYMQAGRTLSCGCLRSEMVSKRRTTHGQTNTREYKIWCKMKERCYLPSARNFHRWGGRGIEVCDRWRKSFSNFIADMGACPEGHSIERIDQDGNYEPGNCRWATQREQMNNMSRNVIIEHDGKSQSVAEWAREIGVKYDTLLRRIRCGEIPPHAFRQVRQ